VSLVRLFRNVVPLAAVACFALGAGACSETPTSPSGSVAFSQTDVVEGSGTVAATGNVLTVHYTGWLYNAAQPENKGGQFDSSAGFDPFSFTLGAGSVIEGWDRGLQGMKVGGVRRLVIPPSLAYGSSRSGVIPPEATLVFDIQLIAVQ
jgi:FKBP-type peptidyl-prolyl cis-trans isomerase FkpA